jgi:uncharacterized protein with GYD domain
MYRIAGGATTHPAPRRAFARPCRFQASPVEQLCAAARRVEACRTAPAALGKPRGWETASMLCVMATRVDPESFDKPADLEDLEKRAMDAIRRHCPDVTWKMSFAVLGPYDYIDVFEAPDIATAQHVSALIRCHGRAHSEIWPATTWKDFEQLIAGQS